MKLGKERRESSKRNYSIIFPRVMIKAIIIIANSVGYRPLRSGTNELKLTTGPYKAARETDVAGSSTYTKSLYE